MAGNRQQFTLQFNADTASAKRAIQDLQSSLDKLSKESLNSNYLDVGIKNAVKSAKELQIHLNKAFDQQTGKLNLNTFNASLKSAGQSASSLMQTLLQGGAAGQAAFTSLAGAIAQSEAPLKRTNALVKDFAQTLKNTVKWEISSTLVHGLEGALSGAVSYAKNLNTSLTNIRIVTGQSADDMARFAQQANKAAKELSTTTKAYADASLIYYQQGDNAEQAAKKAAITIKAANASFNTSAAEMSEYLTSVWNSYQVGANELERYVDIMAALGAKTATSLEEIATSMQKVAATSNTVGVSMEQVSSIIATVSSVTRESAESIGTSYKTIFARIGDLKLGETLEDGIGLGQVSSELSKIGIEILDASGNMRDMGTIIEELGAKWQTMSRAEQTAIAQVVAGKRQYTQLMALFENWDMYQNNMNIAQNADGSLQEMADIYAESWEAASARAQAAMEGLYSQLINDQAIIKLTNALTGITEAISSLIDGFGGLGGTISSLGGIAVAVFNKQIIAALNNAKTNVSTFMSQFQGQGFFKSVGTVLSGKAKNNEQINWQKNQQEWQSSMQAIKSNSSSEQVALANSKGLLSMKQQLIDAESRLTNAQKDRATALISQISMEQSTLLQLTQSYEEAAKALENFQKTSTKDVFRAAQTEAGKGGQRLSLNEAEAELDAYIAYINNDMVSKFGDYKPQDQTYKGVMSSYQSAISDSVTASSGIQELESIQKSAMSAEQKLEQTRKTAEKLKNLFSDSVDASFLDDSKNDAAELIRQLQQVRTIADDVADEIDTAMGDIGSAAGDKTAQAITAQMDGIAQATEEAVKANFSRLGAADSVTSIGEELKNLFDAEATPAAKTFGSVMTKVAGVGMTMVGSFQSGASIVGTWADETATLGDHLSAAAGGISNLVSGFMSGGWIGLAISAITMVVSGIIEANKKAKEEYQKAQNERLEKITEKGESTSEEVSTNASLIQSYNSLYETYLKTGEGQEDLAESAYKLAEAYKAVGANLLIAQGNFEAFNKLIGQKVAQDFSKKIEEYEGLINGTTNLLQDDSKNSSYRFTEGQADTSYYTAKELTNPSAGLGLMHGVYGPEYYQYLGYEPDEAQALYDKQLRGYQYTAAIGNGASGTDITLMGYGRSKDWNHYLSENVHTWGADDNTLDIDVDKFMQDIYQQTGSYEAAAQYFMSMMQAQGVQLSEEFKQELLSYDGTSQIGKKSFDFRGQDREIRNGSFDFMDYVEETYEKYYGENGKFLTDYEKNFFGSDGILDWNELTIEEKDARWQEIQDTMAQIETEKASIETRMAELQEAGLEDSYEYQILQQRLDYLTDLHEVYDGLISNENISGVMTERRGYQQQIAQLRLAQSSITSLIGENEETIDFSTFSDHMAQLIAGIKENRTFYQEELGKFFNEEGEMIEGMEEEYEYAVQQIALGLINQYTSFDDYGKIWSALGSFFPDTTQLAAVTDLVSTYNFGSEDITMDFVLAAQSVMDGIDRTIENIDDRAAAYAEALENDPVLKALKQGADKDKAFSVKETNQNVATQAKSLISDSMTADDAAQVYDLLWSEDSLYEGDLIPWEDFIKLSETEQQAYLDKIIADDQAGMADLAAERATSRRAIFTEWQNKWKNLIAETTVNGEVKTAEMQMAEEEAHFNDWLIENGYSYDGTNYIDSEGNIVDLGTYTFLYSNVEVAFGGDIQEVLDENELGRSLDDSADGAEAAAKGWEMLGSQTESTAKKINRFKSALSGLPTDLENLKALAEDLGLSMDQLFDLSDLELAKKIFKTLEMPSLADFTLSDGTIDYTGYAAAMQAYEETYASAASIIMSESKSEFEALQGQLEEADKKADKIKQKAEALQSAIESGELSFEQQTLFSAEELAAWNQAANATERAAVAANMWSKHAAEVTANAEQTSAFYTNAANNNFYGQDDKHWGAQGDLFGAEGQQNFENMLAEYETKGWFDPGEAAAWSTAYQSALSKGLLEGKTSNLEVIEVVRQELLSMADDATEEGKQAAAAAVDMIRSIFASIAEEEQAAADAAINAWENAFMRIAELRKKILSGEDITGDIFGSGFDNLWQQFKDSGYTDYTSFSTDVKSGNYNPELPTFDLNEYMASVGIEQFAGLKGESDNFIYRRDMLDAYRADYIANGGDEQTADDWAYEQVQEDVRTALTNYNGVNGTNYDVDEAVAAYMNGDWTKQFDDGTGKMVTASQLFNMAADTMSDAGSQMSADMLWYQQQQEIMSEGQGIVADLAENQTYAVGTGEANQEELLLLQAAIQRAQEEKYTGEGDWSNLSSADQDLLSSYGIGFDNVDMAAEQCANGLTALAEVAYQAMEAFLLGKGYEHKEDGWYDSSGVLDEGMTEYMDGLDTARQDAYHSAEDDAKRLEKLQEESKEKEWEGFGLDPDEVDEFGDHLQGMAEASEELSDSLKDNADIADEVAKEIMRFGEACKDVRENYEDWMDALESDNMEDQAKAIKKMDKAYSDMLDLDYDTLSDQFLRNTDNLELMKQAAEGSEEAYNSLQEAARKDIAMQIGLDDSAFQNQFNNLLQQYYGAQNLDDIEIGAALNDAGFLAALSRMVTAAGMTAEQATDYLASMGVDATVKTKKTTSKEIVGNNLVAHAGVRRVPYTVPVDGGKGVRKGVATFPYVTYTSEPVYATKETEAVALEVTSAHKSSGGAFKFDNSSAASGSGSGSGGGGGGGGGGTPKTLDVKDPNDEKQRYFQIDNALERMADTLEKVDKLKRRAFGEGYLKNLDSEISLLKQEIDLQQEYINQAKEWLAVDKQRVASLGATFDGEGNISNYNDLMDSIIAKYNAFIEKYNAASASEQENMEEEKEQMDEWYEDAIDWISQYEDTLNIIRDKENEILELQNEISAKTLEGIQYKVEFEVELNEEEVDFLDYLNEKYSEVLEKQDEMVENLVKQQQLAQENLGYLNNAKAELDAKFASGELNQADYVAGLQDINDQILENLSTLEELRKEIQEAYGNALEMASEAIDNHTEKMEHASQVMQSYISIMGLIGKGVDYDKLSDYYDKQYTYNLKSLETQQQYLEVLKEEESYYLAKLAAGDLTETERIQFEALQDTIAEVEDGILAKTEETLSALREAFSIAVEGILRDFEESVAGSGNTLEDLAADYEYYLEVQERHVSTSKELYEISKLNRQIEQDIADTSSSVYKQRLAALQEEIKAKSADRALTEYDIQMMNLEYELLQRQMALEEAKNAKDTVRLTRDSSGNYVYQYTADQDAISEAQQGVEDVLQQMAEANAERVTQLEQETINTYQNMVSQIEEIANSEVLTQEEKNAKIAEIVAQAQEKMLWLQDQYGIATENTMATNALIQDHYNTDMITNAQISSEAMNETIAAIINKSAELSDGMATMQEQIGQEMAELEYDINTVLNTTAWDDAGEKISTYDQVVDDATTEVDEMIDALSGEDGLLDSIKDTTTAWDAQAAAIDALIKYYEDLYVSITKAQNAQANVTNPSTGGSVTDPGTDTETPEEEEETPEESNKVQYQGGTWKFYTYGQESGGKKGAIFYGNGKAPVVTKEDEGDNRIKISGEDGKGNTFSSRWIAKVHRGKELWKAYAMGGLVDYTGPAWVDGTKSQPELMLNATDTQNMLAAVQTVRALDSATLNMLDEFIKLATSSMLSADNLHASGVASTDTELQQQVQITAEFPNVQDSNEIQDAFDNLINRAAQYIGSKK